MKTKTSDIKAAKIFRIKYFLGKIQRNIKSGKYTLAEIKKMEAKLNKMAK